MDHDRLERPGRRIARPLIISGVALRRLLSEETVI
jgi:hypothetical protein